MLSNHYLREVGYVFIGVCLFVFVCFLAGLRKNTQFGGKVAHWPKKKPLGFGSNPDHVKLRLGLGLGLG